jgi:hypothetical protein
MDKAPMHTPGPWAIRKNFNGRGALDLFGEGGQMIIGNALIIKQEANARLIAAAPELLEVANKAFDFLGGVDGAAEIRAELLSAIAKATQP